MCLGSFRYVVMWLPLLERDPDISLVGERGFRGKGEGNVRGSFEVIDQ